jgi:predicted Rossmann fold nucleotide-binding protein DprA/Smf involved in DNA uptake
VLACGIGQCAPFEGVVRVSASAPMAPFTAGQAAERNALLYALGRAAVVVEPRLRTGGSWQGALDALRRRLAVVALPTEAPGPGGAALAALGGVWLSSAGQAATVLGLEPPQAQPGLFGAGEVREPTVWSA